jgi:nucleoside-diphosphate-sugar epimerase
VRAASRTHHALPGGECVLIGDIGRSTDWSVAFAGGVDAVIHTAARVHVLRDTPDGARAHVETNEEGTRRLAEFAARSNVRRFIYLSSIKVNGERTTDRPFTARDAPSPRDPYGESKWRAEQSLHEISERTGMQVAIVRPPLVYGPNVRANFLRLMQWVDRSRPLPLGRVKNRRSLVSVWNLCDLLVALISHPDAAGRAWLVSDGEDLSTPALVRRIAAAMGRVARLVPVPLAALELLGTLTGRRSEIERLCGSLECDISETRSVLAWKPPVSVDEGIARTVSWYVASRGAQ